MLHFTWKVFSETGNIDTYLLFKELEKEHETRTEDFDEELAQIDSTIS